MTLTLSPVTSETLARIIECGALAPSGDNLQPWQVRFVEAGVEVSVNRARDRSLYNFQYRASLFALGAMIENMVIAARHYGLSAQVTMSSAGDELPAATLRFDPADQISEPLFDAIARRCTNRRPYQNRPVSADALARLGDSIPADRRSRLLFIEDRDARRRVARAASLNDRTFLEIRELHDRFYESIRWTEADAERSRDGLFVRTLELGPTALAFRAMKSWLFVQTMAALGGTRLAPMHSYQTFMRSPVFGFLQMAKDTPLDFVEGGRRMQRVWLTATSLGLSLQPMAGMLCLLPYLRSSDTSIVPKGPRALIEKAERLFETVLPLGAGQAPILLFRLGYGPSPSARSLRQAVEPSR